VPRRRPHRPGRAEQHRRQPPPPFARIDGNRIDVQLVDDDQQAQKRHAAAGVRST
jgi:hypothetical protein